MFYKFIGVGALHNCKEQMHPILFEFRMVAAHSDFRFDVLHRIAGESESQLLHST